MNLIIKSRTFRVWGIDVQCHVFADGRRVVESDSLDRLEAAMNAPGRVLPTDQGALDFLDWMEGKGEA